MRMFTRLKTGSEVAKPDVAYCCQEDGMVGLGCGARSYTTRLHYASEYAVGAPGVRDILRDYVGKTAEAFQFADYGYALSEAEQKRRFVIQSLLQTSGLDLSAYLQRFGTRSPRGFPRTGRTHHARIGRTQRQRAAINPGRHGTLGQHWPLALLPRSQRPDANLRAALITILIALNGWRPLVDIPLLPKKPKRRGTHKGRR